MSAQHTRVQLMIFYEFKFYSVHIWRVLLKLLNIAVHLFTSDSCKCYCYYPGLCLFAPTVRSHTHTCARAREVAAFFSAARINEFNLYRVHVAH